MDDNDKIREELKFYFDKKISIHITFISNNWVNGLIKEIKEDKIILDERKFGEMLIFIDRIKNIAPQIKEETK